LDRCDVMLREVYKGIKKGDDKGEINSERRKKTHPSIYSKSK